MRKFIMWNANTLDGYFEGKEAWDLDFLELVWGKELEKFSIEQLKSADMLVFGEATYKGMADHWPEAGGGGDSRAYEQDPQGRLLQNTPNGRME